MAEAAEGKQEQNPKSAAPSRNIAGCASSPFAALQAEAGLSHDWAS
jgi:hypothetical protein